MGQGGGGVFLVLNVLLLREQAGKGCMGNGSQGVQTIAAAVGATKQL